MKNIFDQLKADKSKCAGTGSGTDFCDAENEGSSVQAQGISGIEIRTGHIMDAIGVIYGADSHAKLHGNPKGGTSQRIMFEEGDNLKSIEGICDVNYAGNKTFSRLIIRTEKGRQYGAFGRAEKGKAFRLEVPEGKIFAGFFGKKDNTAVHSLGLIFTDKSADASGMFGNGLGMDELGGLDGLL